MHFLNYFQAKKLMVVYEERVNHQTDNQNNIEKDRNINQNINLFSESTNSIGSGSDMGVVVKMEHVNPQDVYIDVNHAEELMHTENGIPLYEDGSLLIEPHEADEFLMAAEDEALQQTSVSMETEDGRNDELVEGHSADDINKLEDDSFQSSSNESIERKSDVIDQSNQILDVGVSKEKKVTNKTKSAKNIKSSSRSYEESVAKSAKTSSRSEETDCRENTRLGRTKLNTQRRAVRRKRLRDERSRVSVKPLSPLNKVASRFRRPTRKVLLASPAVKQPLLKSPNKKTLLSSPPTTPTETNPQTTVSESLGSRSTTQHSSSQTTNVSTSQPHTGVQSNVATGRPIIRQGASSGLLCNRVLLGNQYGGTPIQQVRTAGMTLNTPGVRAALLNRTAAVSGPGIQAKMAQQRILAQTPQGFAAQSQQAFAAASAGYSGHQQQSFVAQAQQSYGSSAGYSTHLIQQSQVHNTTGVIQNTVQQTVMVQNNPGLATGRVPAHSLLRGDNVYKAQRYNPLISQLTGIRGRR